MNNALRLPGWEVTAMRQSNAVIEISARYLPVPDSCIKCGSMRRPDRYGAKQIDYQDLPWVTVCGSCHYHLRDIHIPKELPSWIEIRNGTDVYIRKSG